MKYRKIFYTLTALVLVLGLVQTPEAALNAVDPGPYTAATGFFPLWYQDDRGVAIELCWSPTISPDPAAAGGTLCTLLAAPGVFDPALPIAFPGNFPPESFYLAVGGRVKDPGIGPKFDVSFVINLESTFATGVVNNGDQVTFSRIRIRGTADTLGFYTITHPYGVENIDVINTGARAINITHDIGFAPGVFTGALAGDIGPFLIRTDALGNVSPIVVAAETFIGDPNVNQTFTGSPLGTNYYRVQGPSGIDATSNLATISGKVFKGTTLPTPIDVNRASYAASPVAGSQMYLFATMSPTTIASFTDSALPPDLFAFTGDPLGRFFGEAVVPPAVLGPLSVNASATPYNNPAFPANAPATKAVPVTDLVSITRAEYSIAAQTLVIEASSSDEVTPPVLSSGTAALTMTAVPPVQSLAVTGLLVPPPRVTVTSSAGGSDTENVIILP